MTPSYHQYLNYPITKLTSIRSIGSVRRYIECPTTASLKQAMQDYPQALIIGNGSNTVLSDNLTRPVIRFTDNQAYQLSDTRMYLPASFSTAQSLRMSLTSGLSGLEFAAGVPASLGGMIAMNFSCWGHDIASRLVKLCLWSPEQGLHWVNSRDIKFDYRKTSIKGIIIGAILNLVRQDRAVTQSLIRNFVKQRVAHQPSRLPTYGCMFMNPLTTSKTAGYLIDQVGLKGYRIGDASVSTKHANFMINHGHASITDIKSILHHIHACVLAQFGIDLMPEVSVIDD